MNTRDILSLPSMPLASPNYPKGPYRFIDREYLIITYESGPACLQLIPHVKAPVTDLPVKQVIGHVDLTLPYGRVIHDYMGSK